MARNQPGTRKEVHIEKKWNVKIVKLKKADVPYRSQPQIPAPEEAQEEGKRTNYPLV
jgi:hypothetical protein